CLPRRRLQDGAWPARPPDAVACGAFHRQQPGARQIRAFAARQVLGTCAAAAWSADRGEQARGARGDGACGPDQRLKQSAARCMAKKKDPSRRQIAANRKARFHYEIGETFEAGLALTGTEVKSLRVGKATIAESYADARHNEIWLINANI